MHTRTREMWVMTSPEGGGYKGARLSALSGWVAVAQLVGRIARGDEIRWPLRGGDYLGRCPRLGSSGPLGLRKCVVKTNAIPRAEDERQPTS